MVSNAPAPSESLPAVRILKFLRTCCGILLGLAGVVVAQSQLPYLNGGPNSTFAQFDFSQLFLDEQIQEAIHSGVGTNELTSSGSISIRDLAAPRKAVDQYNYAASYLRSQNAKEAIKCLHKAIDLYPEFVSAHNMLGLAYLEEQDARAKEEFEAAAKLDDRFPVSFLNLGMMALNQNDFASADANLEKAAFLSPRDPRILISLAFAQNGDHKYAESLRTASRVHALNHRGMGNVHYIAASAAMSLHDFAMAQQELGTLLKEDPASPLAPIAQKQLDLLGQRNPQAPQSSSMHVVLQADPSQYRVQTFPDSEYLHAELEAMKNVPDDDCGSCSDARAFAAMGFRPTSYGPAVESWHNLFTIHRAVDETAVFFSVSRGGHPVNDLAMTDIEIRDNDQPPDRILQFVPQSKLPLRLGVLIDTSDSTEKRLQFEKRAAERFVGNVLQGPSDLAFVSGFNSDVSVSQDFTSDPARLNEGIEKLTSGGGTALFDAVYFASWKLAAYPEQDRVAKVLLILTDGEDNSSHRSLKQTIEEAEAAGLTIYTVSTAEDPNSDTDANRILRTLAERSGGASFFPGGLKALEQSLGKLRGVIRNRYLVAYKAAHFAPNGKYHSIRLSAAKDGRHLQVHVRKGYYARLAQNRFQEGPSASSSSFRAER